MGQDAQAEQPRRGDRSSAAPTGLFLKCRRSPTARAAGYFLSSLRDLRMKNLGIESTCDETGASVVEDGRVVLSNVVATQVELHAKYRGVVPEIASRAHIENILPVIGEAAEKAATKLTDVDAI